MTGGQCQAAGVAAGTSSPPGLISRFAHPGTRVIVPLLAPHSQPTSPARETAASAALTASSARSGAPPRFQGARCGLLSDRCGAEPLEWLPVATAARRRRSEAGRCSCLRLTHERFTFLPYRMGNVLAPAPAPDAPSLQALEEEPDCAELLGAFFSRQVRCHVAPRKALCGRAVKSKDQTPP